MLNKQKYLDKIDELVAIAEGIIKGRNNNEEVIPGAVTREFRGSAGTFILSIYGEKSPYYQNFLHSIHHEFVGNYDEAKGVLCGIRKHIEQEWLQSIENTLSIGIFGDYLEMADHLNEQNAYIAAAVIAGTTLEERLRQLCNLYGQAIEAPDKDGKMKALSAESLNSSLANFYTEKKNDVKLVTKNYGLRNEAAHGRWNNDPPEKRNTRIDQVQIMIAEIRLFIKNNPI